MTYINPLAQALPQAALTQQQMAVEKTRHLRRAQTQLRNIAAEDDKLEHEVESTEEVTPIHDEARARQDGKPAQRRKSKAKRSDDPAEPDHIDVKA